MRHDIGIIVLAVALAALRATPAGASCNVIPSAARTFPSTLGALDRPFARPGDTITVLRDEPAFAAAGENRVRVELTPLEAPPVVVEVGTVAGAACPGGDPCAGGLCACLRFVFPDTDSAVGDATDGHGLTGPARILVDTAGRRTATIDRFLLSASGFHDDLFPGFVALPPANRFDALAGGGRVLAARDEPGNLFVPFDFSSLVPDDARRTRFLDALVPSVGDDTLTVVDVFTPEGQRLPPLIRQVRGGSLVGTADSPESVLRIRKGALRPGLGPERGIGPVVIPGVSGSADPLARADPLTMVVGRRFAVFEDRECGPLDEASRCVDLNGDGDRDDYFLRALDLQTPGARPMAIDTIDAGEFAGYPDRFPAFSLYSFSANDHLVAFRIIEIVAQGTSRAVDINGNNVVGELIRSGAFDLERGMPIADAAGSPRQEAAGTLLAYSVAGDCDELRYYDAAGGGEPAPVADQLHDAFCVSRFPVGQLAVPVVFPQMAVAPRTFPFDFAVNGRQIVFVVPEDAQGEDLTGDGDEDDLALVVFDAETGDVVVTGRPVAPPAEPGRAQLAASGRWAAFQCSVARPPLPPAQSACLLDLLAPTRPPTLLCAAHGAGFVVPSLSDALIPCVESEGGLVDLNGDGDLTDRNVLHVATPAPNGLLGERDLRLALLSSLDPKVRGGTLAVGIGEGVQGRDLDGDGITGGSGAGPFVLHVVRRDARVTNLRHRVAASSEPFVQFIDRGLALLGPPPGFLRTIYRDVDEDGAFEETIAGTGRLDDNCPTVANPDQRQSGDEDVGDACLCPLLSVDTVQAYAGSHVRVPVDLDAGRWSVGALGFRTEYGPLDLDTCSEGAVAQAANASATCTEVGAGGAALVAVLNDETTVPVPAIISGEVAGLGFRVAADAQGQTLPVCIRAGSVRIGATTGEEVCAGPVTCGEVRVHPDCTVQGDCNCDGQVNGGDRVCLIAKFFNPSLQGTCACEDCNLSGETNPADAPCITLCRFGLCTTGRVGGAL